MDRLTTLESGCNATINVLHLTFTYTVAALLLDPIRFGSTDGISKRNAANASQHHDN